VGPRFRAIALAVAATVVAGCYGDHHADDRLISGKRARAIAADGSGWHPDHIDARLTTYRSHPDPPLTRKVWIVTYRGGDVCVPLHGPGTAGFGLTNFEYTIDARTGSVISEGSSGRAVSCRV
jgi:hypothetical protein